MKTILKSWLKGQNQVEQHSTSIWFEIWGSRGSGSKKFDFLGKFRKNFDFSGNLTNKKAIFQGKFPRNFNFLQVLSQKFSIFQGNFTKISIFQEKICYLQLFL